MSKEKIDLMVDGGKATVSPALAQKLGPLKMNIQEVLSAVNTKTEVFKGMKVPVKVVVDPDTKAFDIEVGTPPTTQLLMNEIALKKGSPTPNTLKVSNITIEQVIKVALMKWDSLYANSLKNAVKTVLGSCNSLGVLVEGKPAADVVKEVEAGIYNKELEKKATEPSKEKLASYKPLLAQIEVAIKAYDVKKAQEAEAKAAKANAAPAAAAATPAKIKKG